MGMLEWLTLPVTGPIRGIMWIAQQAADQAEREIYDPTVGSGGFLIQSHQYVEEQGENANDLALYGQDSNGTVWSICIMNMILHNITRCTIENADTLEDPKFLDHGQVRKFDRVLAYTAFSLGTGVAFPKSAPPPLGRVAKDQQLRWR